MILVDVYVPSLDRQYDFSLKSNVEIQIILEEIAEMIAQKEHSEIIGRIEDLLLCDEKTKRILQKDKTLEECGIQTGNKLILA